MGMEEVTASKLKMRKVIIIHAFQSTAALGSMARSTVFKDVFGSFV